ncbi:unnamed protein product [Periconia digitata]|uniref:F-box domain-containing protein n=1 Tax=Periconia digitata TaxID=1303443 RepID=A0A9W4U3P9_9PLEO|nr:unnamed protein product [Periconia digitata]
MRSLSILNPALHHQIMVLQSLPTELLHHVAYYTSPEDIIALTETCVALRDVYDDHTVWKQSFLQHMPDLFRSEMGSKEAWVERMARQIIDTKGATGFAQADQIRRKWKCLWITVQELQHARVDWRRLVGAIFSNARSVKPEELPNEHRETSVGKLLGRSLSVLPLSMAWGFSTSCDIEILSALANLCTGFYSLGISTLSLDLNIIIQSRMAEISFCMAASAIHTGLRIQRDPTYHYGDDSLRLFKNGLDFVDSTLLEFVKENPDIYRSDSPKFFPRHLALAICASSATACWYSQLQDTAQLPCLPRRSHEPSLGTVGSSTEEYLTAQYLPLPEWHPLLTPYRSIFSTSGWLLWYKPRIQSIIDAIEDGLWEGCYTMPSCRPGFVRFYQRIERIQFHISHQRNHQILFEAENCVDDSGAFSLNGRLHTERETLSAAKRDPSGTTIMFWTGAVTPMGITGYLYDDIRHAPPRPKRNLRGTFWLWKKDWKATGDN